jgi:formate hydrogenlyase transcriptional activator
VRRRASKAQNTYLIEEIKETHNFEEIVGQSRALAEVIEKVKLVASTDSSVLILGETGTGKELVARAVHSNSERRNRPLVKVNCAALPVGLIESELFGHEKGAFTGAIDRRIGRFELAHGGTIFLDEIGDMPPDLQVKLLRVLQEHEFERVGGSNLIKVDVRVIAATNRDLFRSASEGTFRQDLYYRLNVFPIQLPPLRERREDIPPLVHYFVRRFSLKIGRKITRIQRDTMERMMNYSWPGNVRELENVIERAVILSPGIELEVAPGVLPEIAAVASAQAAAPRPAPEEKSPAPSPQSSDQVERNHILEVLMRTNWRIEGSDGAAALLNLNPSTLRSRMKKLGVQRSTQAVS